MCILLIPSLCSSTVKSSVTKRGQCVYCSSPVYAVVKLNPQSNMLHYIWQRYLTFTLNKNVSKNVDGKKTKTVNYLHFYIPIQHIALHLKISLGYLDSFTIHILWLSVIAMYTCKLSRAKCPCRFHLLVRLYIYRYIRVRSTTRQTSLITTQ